MKKKKRQVIFLDMKPSMVYLSLIFFLCSMGMTINCKKSSEPDQGTVYFLVAELVPNYGDSYILPLTDPEAIAKAERIIAGTQRSQIVHARIVRGSGDGTYLNKDLAGNGRVWSWHVDEFLGFVDITAEIYDAWPTYLEENLDWWLEQNKGIIGFWAYRVKRKVDPSELR